MVVNPTLRDQIAMAALAGLLADTGLSATATDYARVSYELADAMLEARLRASPPTPTGEGSAPDRPAKGRAQRRG